MKTIRFSGFALFTALAFPLLLNAQQAAPSATGAAVVPRLVNFSGTAVNAQGKPLSGTAGITFSIYKDQTDGAPLWMETQSVQADGKGNYSIQLGATKSAGLPVELFASGEARWLGVRVDGGEEQPRVMLLSVPYALKAGDAATIGGLPPSAFMLAVPPRSGAVGTSGDVAGSNPVAGAPAPASTVTTAGGIVNALPLWTTATNVQSSAITQTGSGATAKIGIGTTAPAAALDVKGSEYVRGALTLPATGNATAAAGKNSQPLDLIASSFSGASSTALNQKFQWQAEPAANDTANPSGTLNLLYGLGATTPSETGLKLATNGQITFATGQTFPGTGTITGVSTASGGGLMGGGTSGNLNVGLTNACASKQALAWNGSSWACTTLATQGVTSVGLTAPATDFTVSGSPVTSAGTVGLKWNIAPSSSNTPNAIVKRDAAGNFNANEITALNTADGIALFANDSSPGGGWGVAGQSSNYIGVEGDGGTYGVVGKGPTGVYGEGQSLGIYAHSALGQALVADTSSFSQGDTLVTINEGGAFRFYASGTGGAVYITATGDLVASGSINGSSKNFRVDHPLDPENKYLYHASVESSEMMNIYTGNATTDGQGLATVQLPDWFEAVNADFRYQLTVVGQFAQAIVARKILGHQFEIRTNAPEVEVSWQVTAVRHDAYAKAHPLVVEQGKPVSEQGRYVHPEIYGAPREKAVDWAHHPKPMQPPGAPRDPLSPTGARIIATPAKP